jgi:tetratricopeptide (TPR) repeat protein
MSSREDDFTNHDQEAIEAAWHEDEFEIASAEGSSADEKKTLFFHFISLIRRLSGRSRPTIESVETDFLPDAESDFEIGDDRNLEKFQRHTKKTTGSVADTSHFDSQGQSSYHLEDEFDIAQKSGNFHSYQTDEQTPGAAQESLMQSVDDDFDVIAQKKLPKNIAREHITSDFIEIVRDDFDIAGKSNESSNFSEFDNQPNQGSDLSAETEFEEISPEDPHRQKIKSILQDQIEDFIHRIDRPDNDLLQDSDPDPAQADLNSEEQLTAASIPEQKFNVFALLITGLLHLLRWLALLPIRAITQPGEIHQQRRSRLEPLVLGLPALFMIVSIYLSQIWLQTKDLLRESTRLSTIASQELAARELKPAKIAASQLCAQARTPANLWLLSEVMLASPDNAEKMAALRLIGALASPEYNDLANAHLFLAKKAWNTQDMKVEEVPQYLNQVKYHLRTGLSAEPNRTDILVMLLDLLMTTSELDEVVRLVTPRLEAWPNGYYYLARIAFKRGDKINQEIFARFIVNRYDSLSDVSDLSPVDRERYLMCLALAGYWPRAEPLINQWIGGLEGIKAVNFWKNRFLAIKAIGMLDMKPEEYDPIVKELIFAIKNNPENQELWNALTRFADRDKPFADDYYKEGIRLVREKIKSLDSTELMIWGNLARKKNDPTTSRALLESSVKLDPENMIAANNLANLLYKIDPKEPDRALTLIQGVLKAEPDNLIYIETRGQILAILGRDNEAINDLLRSLSAFPDIGEIHETLIALYRKKGREDLARFHETRLREIAAKARAAKAEDRQKPASEE